MFENLDTFVNSYPAVLARFAYKRLKLNFLSGIVIAINNPMKLMPMDTKNRVDDLKNGCKAKDDPMWKYKLYLYTKLARKHFGNSRLGNTVHEKTLALAGTNLP